MRMIVPFIIGMLTVGCASAPTQVSIADVFSKDYGTGESLMPDEACAKAHAEAESNPQVSKNAFLFGIWRSDTGISTVNDIAPLVYLEGYEFWHSPVSVLEAILTESVEKNEIQSFDFASEEACVSLWY